MKNKHIERLIKSAKIRAKRWNRPDMTQLGTVIYHVYEPGRKIGWWDDVAFKVGSQVVTVCWIHPRMAYSDATDRLAYDLAPEQPNTKLCDYHLQPEKFSTYLKNPVRANWMKDVRAAKKLIQDTGSIEIRASIKVTHTSRGRLVELCMPMEVVCLESAEAMAQITKKILRGDTTLDIMFPGYVYNKDTWNAEKQENWALV
jgi:hypothetical protein